MFSRNEIITAAHCIPKEIWPEDRIYFRAGSANRESGSLHNLDYVRLHPLRNPKDPSYDIAFVRVEEPFKFSKKLRPIRVRNSEPKSGSVVMLAGWGRAKPLGDPPKELRAVNLTMWDADDCRSKFNTTLYNTKHPKVLKCMKNIGEGSSKSACEGDSGSGVVYRNKLVGVLKSLAFSGPSTPSSTAKLTCNVSNIINLYNSAVQIKSWIGEMISESEKLGRR